MPKGNIIDLEKNEHLLVKVKRYAKDRGVVLKTNQQLVDYAIEIWNDFVEKESQMKNKNK